LFRISCFEIRIFFAHAPHAVVYPLCPATDLWDMVSIYRGVGGAVSGDDDVIGEPDGEAGGGDGVGCVGQVICLCPYIPAIRPKGPETAPEHSNGRKKTGNGQISCNVKNNVPAIFSC